MTLPTKRNLANVLMTVECKLCRKLRYKGYFRDFCEKQKKTRHSMTLPAKSNPPNVLMTVGFLFFKTECEFHRFVS